ncbi:cytochrome P450 [Aspergillus undulatus]|uniref:cytochrome P450 n=1 Tax=Aspergillus undulatus TaxID=1810928 RepID=UPI003CCDEC79
MDASLIWLILLGLSIFLLARAIYRLYFHPLSHIPGPKLAAISGLYEFYYDVCRSGRFLFQIEKMHRKYGPIVRITPREVHISDPEFYEIYAPSSRRREKDPNFITGFSVRESMITTINHEHHRFRRAILDNFFSRRSVVDLTPMISERIEKLMQRFNEFYSDQAVVQLDDAFAALTADIITYYCYGKLWGFLENKNFRSDIRSITTESTGLIHINRFFPFLVPLIRKTPDWIGRVLLPGKTALFDFQKSVLIEANNRTTYRSLTDPSLPLEERSTQRLEEETLVVLAAGTETTGRTLTIAAYHLAQSPSILHQLREEVKQVLSTATSTCTLLELERLPYLTATVNETSPVVFRLPRVAPDETLMYKDYTIPPGTPMSSSSLLLHRNPTTFPDPEKFDPDRWICNNGKTATGERFDRYLAPFTKGSRACLGMSLAYAELYMTLAYFVRRVDFELYNTWPEDVSICRDLGTGYNQHSEPRVYAKVTGIL